MIFFFQFLRDPPFLLTHTLLKKEKRKGKERKKPPTNSQINTNMKKTNTIKNAKENEAKGRHKAT